MQQEQKSRLKIPFLLAAAALLFAAVWLLLPPSSAERLEQPYRIWVASDLHDLSPQLAGDGHFFSTPTAAGDGKTVQYSDEIAAALCWQAKQEQPDLLILSGDLTLNGAKQSHLELSEMLADLQESGVQVLVIAGNHDVDGSGGDYSGEEIQLVEGLSSEEFLDVYGAFGWQQALSRDEQSASFVYEATEKLRILMLDANCGGRGFAKPGMLIWMQEQLAAAKKEGVKVVAVSHQNLYAHNELLSFGYQLYNAPQVQQLYEEYGVRANLSGHIHIQSMVTDFPVLEIATASLSVMPNTFGEIVYDGRNFAYTARSCDVQGWAAAVGVQDENLLDFSHYCWWFFEQSAREKVLQRLAGSGLSEEQQELLADTFARINSAYFSGFGASREEHAEGLALWQQQPDAGFYLRYFESMLEAGEKNQLELSF